MSETDWIDRETVLEPRAAVYILQVMEKVANADSNFTEAEFEFLAAVRKALAGLQGMPDPERRAMAPEDLQDALMRSACFAALADGVITKAERELIEQFGERVRLEPHDVSLRIVSVKQYFQGEVTDVTLLRAAALQVAIEAGLSEEALAALAGGGDEETA